MKKSVDVYKVNVDDIISTEPILYGSINDIRAFMKYRWSDCGDYVKDIMNIEIEEDYYYHIDNDDNLFKTMDTMGYKKDTVCRIHIEDFME